MAVKTWDGRPLVAPFPYFGGKRPIADVVWHALSDVKHYIEPFFGSGAVLLERPNYDPLRHVETVCDKNGMLCNVWRAMKAEPSKLAELCDWPVNHADLMARKRFLLANEQSLLERLVENDEWYDLKAAAYWIWVASCSIGRWESNLTQRPHLSHSGEGVHKLSLRRSASVPIDGAIPHLSDARKAIHGLTIRDGDVRANLTQWFEALAARLRHVRVVCGDWSRVCGGNWQDRIGTTGIFFDPPYSHDIGRDNNLYRCDENVSRPVGQWALERGQRPSYRIVVAGYEGEHPELENASWRVVEWRASGGYRNQGKAENTNRFRERLWLSPHCEF
jgi:site-specific DNA-adenine methylase